MVGHQLQSQATALSLLRHSMTLTSTTSGESSHNQRIDLSGPRGIPRDDLDQGSLDCSLYCGLLFQPLPTRQLGRLSRSLTPSFLVPLSRLRVTGHGLRVWSRLAVLGWRNSTSSRSRALPCWRRYPGTSESFGRGKSWRTPRTPIGSWRHTIPRVCDAYSLRTRPDKRVSLAQRTTSLPTRCAYP